MNLGLIQNAAITWYSFLQGREEAKWVKNEMFTWQKAKLILTIMTTKTNPVVWHKLRQGLGYKNKNEARAWSMENFTGPPIFFSWGWCQDWFSCTLYWVWALKLVQQNWSSFFGTGDKSLTKFVNARGKNSFFETFFLKLCWRWGRVKRLHPYLIVLSNVKWTTLSGLVRLTKTKAKCLE